MEIYEITGYQSGVARDGVNFLEPSDSFTDVIDGFVHRQILQSRRGISIFASRLSGNTRITGIFEFIQPDGTRDLLATDMNHLYKYNVGTDVFDQIVFGGSMAGYAGFAFANNEDYISGTAYPTKSNSQRFIITGKSVALNANGSGVFFYDGVSVKDFMNAGDNPDFAQPVGLTLVRSTYAIYFGERLNFIVPKFTSTVENQGILFSGIRNSAGNGDKFNVAGSGLIILDTYEDIRGASILGDWIALNLSRSNWTLEKTRDAFNPYFPRKIPSVLGTDAPFSFNQWDGRVNSLGKTGIISMDGNQSSRIDNKIPYFTQDSMDAEQFELAYGGFDRQNAQFLFSYKTAGSDTDTQDAVLVNNYEENSWSVFNLNLTVFGQSDIGRGLLWNEIDENAVPANPSWAQWNTTEDTWNKIGLTSDIEKTLAGDDLGFIYMLNQGNDDTSTAITAITQASQAVLTVSASAFVAGDEVVVSIVEGMTEINNFDPSTDDDDFVVYNVVSSTPTAITLNVDSSGFTAYTTGGFISKLINFSAKTNPFNPYRAQGKKCFISMVEFLINSDGKMNVDVFADDESTPFKRNVLIKPYNTLKQRNWIEMSINNEADFFNFQMRSKYPNLSTQITSIRIHTMPGGLSNG